MQLLKFLVIDLTVMRQLDITLYEYALMAMIHKLSSNPNSKHVGWCYASKETLASNISYSARGLFKMIDRLESKGLLVRNEQGFTKATQKWYDLTEVDMNSVHSEQKSTYELSSQPPMNSVQSGYELSSHDKGKDIYTDNSNINPAPGREDPKAPTTDETYDERKAKAINAFNDDIKAIEMEVLSGLPIPPIDPPKDKLPERLINHFAMLYQEYREVPYLANGSDKKAIGTILGHYRKIKPKSDTEQCFDDLCKFFQQCMGVDDAFLQNGMSLRFIASYFTQFMDRIKNGRHREKTDAQRRAEYRADISPEYVAKRKAQLAKIGITD